MLRQLWYLEYESKCSAFGSKVLVEGLQSTDSQPAASPMADYYDLQRRLLLVMVVLTAVLFPATYVLYSLNVAISYLLGALAGMMYFYLLGKAVASLGVQKDRVGGLRLLVVGLVFAISIKLNMLQVVPTFLGFMTLKVAILGDALWFMYRDALR